MTFEEKHLHLRADICILLNSVLVVTIYALILKGAECDEHYPVRNDVSLATTYIISCFFLLLFFYLKIAESFV